MADSGRSTSSLWSAFSMLLAATFSSTGALAAQEKIEIPARGWYEAEGVLTERTLEKGNATIRLEGLNEHARFYLEPTECGQSIGMQTPDRLVTLDFSEDHWFGEDDFYTSVLTVKLFPVSQYAMRGEFHIESKGSVGQGLPVAMTQDWEVLFRHETPEGNVGPETGRGRVFNPYDDPQHRRVVEKQNGVWREEKAEYTVAVWDFYVNDAELLPFHEAALDEAISYAMIQDDDSCHSEELIGFSRAVGYASQTGPDAINNQLAQRRARAVAEYLTNNANGLFPPEEYLESNPLHAHLPYARAGAEALHDLPNLESSCNRAAAISFWKQRRYVDPYAKDEARGWLDRWLRAAKLLSDPAARDLELRRAKSRFVLAMNYLDLIEAGHCEPAPDTPAHEFFRDTQENAETALINAWNMAAEMERRRIAQMYDSRQAARRDRQRRLTDPYYQYTWKENPEAEAVADEAEERILNETDQTEGP